MKIFLNRLNAIILGLFCYSIMGQEQARTSFTIHEPVAIHAPDDPFLDLIDTELEHDESPTHDIRSELKSFYQGNSLRGDHPFNPYPTDNEWLDSSTSHLGFDIAVDSSWNSRWTSRVRAFKYYQSFGGDKSDINESALLEAAVNWQAKNNRLSLELGRRKPQWSEGFSYDIANLLEPQRNKPYVDQDNPLQTKGWDMLNIQYIDESWSYSGYIISSESKVNNASSEFLLRLAHQGNNSVSFILHQIANEQFALAATYGRLLSDNLSLRTEWTAHPYRQTALNVGVEELNEYYHRLAVGANYTADSGWSLLAELFHNQHGLSDLEWQQNSLIYSSAAQRVLSEQSLDFAGDYELAFQGFGLIRTGWLRRNYLSLLYISEETSNFWQLKLNSQINLDDNSSLVRLVLSKSFNDNLTARFQIENFSGCELCEYGLNPNENSTRFVLSWLF